MIPPAVSSASDEAEADTPWAMQLVVRVERRDPPGATAVLEAAATAVVKLLADERAAEGGWWHEAVDAWQTGRLRKLARRARGAAWDRAQAVPGVTVTVSGAEVRAAVPGPTDAVPDEIHKLQVSGLDLADPQRRVSFEPEAGWPGLLISVSPEHPMTTGKLAAQAGHASHLAWTAMDCGRRAAWAAGGFPIVVIRPDPAGWASFATGAPVLVTDGGFTEIPEGTQTAAARWY